MPRNEALYRQLPQLRGALVDHTFWLTPGHASEAGVWYVGTSPQGPFRSEDAGADWKPLNAIRRHIRIFVNGEQVRVPDFPLGSSDEVFIVQALSGG